MQRTRAQQERDARPHARTWVRRALAAVALLVGAGALGTVAVAYVRRPALRPECTARYRRARTAADTAVVDAVHIERKDPSFQTCGSQRAAFERGLTD